MLSDSADKVYLVVNPVSGKGDAPSFVERIVQPILDLTELEYETRTTESDRGGIALGKQLFAERASARGPGERTTLLVAGGDGTAHELIEGILTAAKAAKTNAGRWDLAILPLGTANALFWSLFPGQQALASVDSLPATVRSHLEQTEYTLADRHALSSLTRWLSVDTKPRSLPITQTTVHGADAKEDFTDDIPSHIVLSTSLHAAILQSSEALREEYPGTERFKMAAKQNAGVFYPARVILHGNVQQYSPATKAFTTPFTGTTAHEPDGPTVELEGPFAYFLTSTIAPRLEPSFVISPTLQRLPPSHASGSVAATMDITILRPMRDGRVAQASKEGGESKASDGWVPRAWEVLGKAYEDGAHIDLVYDREGNAVAYDAMEEKGDPRSVVVETFRCEYVDWKPTDASHTASLLICADGSLHQIPLGGWFRSYNMKQDGEHGFRVYA